MEKDEGGWRRMKEDGENKRMKELRGGGRGYVDHMTFNQDFENTGSRRPAFKSCFW